MTKKYAKSISMELIVEHFDENPDIYFQNEAIRSLMNHFNCSWMTAYRRLREYEWTYDRHFYTKNDLSVECNRIRTEAPHIAYKSRKWRALYMMIRLHNDINIAKWEKQYDQKAK